MVPQDETHRGNRRQSDRQNRRCPVPRYRILSKCSLSHPEIPHNTSNSSQFFKNGHCSIPCRQGFATRIPITTAVPRLLLSVNNTIHTNLLSIDGGSIQVVAIRHLRYTRNKRLMTVLDILIHRRFLPQRRDRTYFSYFLPQLQKLLPKADQFHNPSPLICFQLLLQKAIAEAQSAAPISEISSIQLQAAWSCQADHIMTKADQVCYRTSKTIGKCSMMARSTSYYDA